MHFFDLTNGDRIGLTYATSTGIGTFSYYNEHGVFSGCFYVPECREHIDGAAPCVELFRLHRDKNAALFFEYESVWVRSEDWHETFRGGYLVDPATYWTYLRELCGLS